MAPSQDASDQQDYEPFLGLGIPKKKPSFTTVYWEGATFNEYDNIISPVPFWNIVKEAPDIYSP